MSARLDLARELIAADAALDDLRDWLTKAYVHAQGNARRAEEGLGSGEPGEWWALSEEIGRLRSVVYDEGFDSQLRNLLRSALAVEKIG